MSDESKYRSRNRGRGRSTTPSSTSAQPSRGGRGDHREVISSASHQQQQAPPLQGAWARRPGTSEPMHGLGRQSAPHETVQAAQLSYAAPGSSRSAGPSGPPPSGPPAHHHEQRMEGVVGGGGEPSSLGRGALRGRRVIDSELLLTKPSSLVTKQGTEGKSVKLEANYFKMLTSTDWCMYKYRVDFAPEEDRTAVRKGMLRTHKETLGAYIFDGTVLYTSHRLAQPMELCSVRQSDEQKMMIKVRLAGDMAMGDEHYLQFFNIIMRKCLEYLQLQQVGRNYFDARNKVEVRQHRLELWPGYETSIRQHERGILMAAEITHKVMRQQTLLDLLNDAYNRHGDQYQARFSAAVIGVTVLTDYNNQTYRIDDVDYTVSPNSTFMRKGEAITYKDYYYSKYQIQIRHATQPLLLSRSKARDRRAGMSESVYLVPELCRSTGLTDEMREDRNMMKDLAVHTRLTPSSRIQRLISFNRRLQTERKVVQELTDWNMRLDHELIQLPGRILDVEKIVYGRGQQGSAGDQADWTRDLKNKQMFVTGKLQDWVIIVPNKFIRDCQEFVGAMRSATRQMQFLIAEPRNYTLGDDRTNSYTAAIEEIMSRANPQLIMCVVPNNRADRYSAIKKKCCIDRPIPTQCIMSRNLNGKGLMSIAAKVAIQLNCKIGGAPWSVVLPVSGLMVVGFDVCHDTNVKNRDFGAMVASLDQPFSRYFSVVSAHTSGEELSNYLAVNMVKALHKYREVNNGALPSRIVVYRDGVSDGQIPYVHGHEVGNIKEKLAAIYGDPNKLRMAYIIVTKRVAARLFYNKNNPPPGTIVDDVITNPLKYDFFIVSQFVKQGSVSPTGYNVISDNVGLDASKLQRLSYKLTHMYFNWSGTVRVPAPCQFAHKLAFLVSQSIHSNPSSHLDSLLYYL